MMNSTWQTLDVRWQAVVGSLLLSVYVLLFPQIPNDDAYVYFRTAEIFLSEGFAAASAHYSWPAYAILIAVISKLGFSLLTSALLINSFFYALLTFGFISLMMTLSQSRSVILVAAVTVLVFPELNEFRFMVIRDTGFWALCVLAMWQLLQYRQRPTLSSALVFAVCLLGAAALRIEALVYLGCLPLLSFLPSERDSASVGSRLLLPALVYGSTLLTLVLLMVIGIDVPGLAANFISTYKPFLENLLSGNGGQSAQLGAQLTALHGELINMPVIGDSVILTLGAELFATLLTGLSGAFFWLLVYGVFKKYWPTRDTFNRELLAWLAINLCIVLAFLFITRFLTSRYVMILCLVLATQIPFVAARILENVRASENEKRYRFLLVLFFAYCFIDAYVTFGDSRGYLRDAADYMAVQNQSNEEILTNNHSIAYASGLVTDYDRVERLPSSEAVLALPAGHYLALELIPEVTELLESAEVSAAVEFVTAFPTEAQPRVGIYRRIE